MAKIFSAVNLLIRPFCALLLALAVGFPTPSEAAPIKFGRSKGGLITLERPGQSDPDPWLAKIPYPEPPSGYAACPHGFWEKNVDWNGAGDAFINACLGEIYGVQQAQALKPLFIKGDLKSAHDFFNVIEDMPNQDMINEVLAKHGRRGRMNPIGAALKAEETLFRLIKCAGNVAVRSYPASPRYRAGRDAFVTLMNEAADTAMLVKDMLDFRSKVRGLNTKAWSYYDPIHIASNLSKSVFDRGRSVAFALQDLETFRDNLLKMWRANIEPAIEEGRKECNPDLMEAKTHGFIGEAQRHLKRFRDHYAWYEKQILCGLYDLREAGSFNGVELDKTEPVDSVYRKVAGLGFDEDFAEAFSGLADSEKGGDSVRKMLVDYRGKFENEHKKLIEEVRSKKNSIQDKYTFFRDQHTTAARECNFVRVAEVKRQFLAAKQDWGKCGEEFTTAKFMSDIEDGYGVGFGTNQWRSDQAGVEKDFRLVKDGGENCTLNIIEPPGNAGLSFLSQKSKGAEALERLDKLISTGRYKCFFSGPERLKKAQELKELYQSPNPDLTRAAQLEQEIADSDWRDEFEESKTKYLEAKRSVDVFRQAIQSIPSNAQLTKLLEDSCDIEGAKAEIGTAEENLASLKKSSEIVDSCKPKLGAEFNKELARAKNHLASWESSISGNVSSTLANARTLNEKAQGYFDSAAGKEGFAGCWELSEAAKLSQSVVDMKISGRTSGARSFWERTQGRGESGFCNSSPELDVEKDKAKALIAKIDQLRDEDYDEQTIQSMYEEAKAQVSLCEFDQAGQIKAKMDEMLRSVCKPPKPDPRQAITKAIESRKKKLLRIVRSFLDSDVPRFEEAVEQCDAGQISRSVEKLKRLNLTDKCLGNLILQGTARKASEKRDAILSWDPEKDTKQRLAQIEGLPASAARSAQAGRTSLNGPQCDTVLATQHKEKGLAAVATLRSISASCAEIKSVKTASQDLETLASEITEKESQVTTDLAEITSIARAFTAAKAACDLKTAITEAEKASTLDVDLSCLRTTTEGARAAAAVEKLKTWPATISSTQAAMARLPREILLAESLVDSCNLTEGTPAVAAARSTAETISSTSSTCLDKIPEAAGLAALESRAIELQNKIANFDKSSYESLVAKAETQLQCSPQLALQTVEEARKLAHALFACTEFKKEPGRLNEIARRAKVRGSSSAGGEPSAEAGELVSQYAKAIEKADKSVTNCAPQAAHSALAQAASLKSSIENLGPECVASVPDDSRIPVIRAKLTELEAKIADYRRGSYSSLVARAKSQISCKPTEALANLTLAEKLGEALFACTDFNIDPSERKSLMQQARSRQNSIPSSSSVGSRINNLNAQVASLTQQGRVLSGKESVNLPEVSSLKRGIVRARASANTLNENSQCFPEHASEIAALLRRIDAIPIPGVRGGSPAPATVARSRPTPETRRPTTPSRTEPSRSGGLDTDIDMGDVAGSTMDEIETAAAGGALGGTPAVGGPSLALPPAPRSGSRGNTFGDAMAAGSAAVERDRARAGPAWAGEPWRQRGGGYGGAEDHPHPTTTPYPSHPRSTGAPGMEFDCFGTCMQTYYANEPRIPLKDRARVRADFTSHCNNQCATVAGALPGTNTRGTTIIRPGTCIGAGCSNSGSSPSRRRRGSGGGC